MEKRESVTVSVLVNAPVEKTWKSFTEPKHIMQWNNASSDWHCPRSENDLKVGGKFSATMAAKDGSFSFDFGGEYTAVKQNESFAYVLGDGRKVKVSFSAKGNQTEVIEIFEAEGQNPVQMQKDGWQAILNNFKKYTESI